MGSTSSAVTTVDSGCANESLWAYNYNAVNYYGGWCSNPDGVGVQKRICFSNSDPSTPDIVQLKDYPLTLCSGGGGGTCSFGNWQGSVVSYWPGTEAGWFGYYIPDKVVDGVHIWGSEVEENFAANSSCVNYSLGYDAQQLSLD